MAADLSTCRKLIWAKRKSTGCESTLTGHALENHGIVLVGHIIYLFNVVSFRSGTVFALNTKTMIWRQVTDRDLNVDSGRSPILVNDKIYILALLYNFNFYDTQAVYFDLQSRELEACNCTGGEVAPNEGYAAEYVEALELVVLYGGTDTGAQHSNRIVGFNVRSNAWSTIKVKGGTPPARRNHCSCLYGKTDIFFFGGNLDGRLKPTSEIFHLNCSGGTFIWNEVGWLPLPVGRANSTMCCVGKRIFIYGGYPTDGTAQSDHVYIYDIHERMGVELHSRKAKPVSGDLNVRIRGAIEKNTLHAAVSSNKTIFVVGGLSLVRNKIAVLSAA